MLSMSMLSPLLIIFTLALSQSFTQRPPFLGWTLAPFGSTLKFKANQKHTKEHKDLVLFCRLQSEQQKWHHMY